MSVICHHQVLDSGVAQGSCFFRNSATTLGPDHGYLRDADGTLGAGDFQFDLSQRKVVQCEFHLRLALPCMGVGAADGAHSSAVAAFFAKNTNQTQRSRRRRIDCWTLYEREVHWHCCEVVQRSGTATLPPCAPPSPCVYKVLGCACKPYSNPNPLPAPVHSPHLHAHRKPKDIEGTRGVDVDDDPDGHGSHVAGSVAGSIYSGWDGPAACPDGVAGATADQTAVSCVGRCLAPSVLEEYASDNTFDLDTLCPDVCMVVYKHTKQRAHQIILPCQRKTRARPSAVFFFFQVRAEMKK